MKIILFKSPWMGWPTKFHLIEDGSEFTLCGQAKLDDIMTTVPFEDIGDLKTINCIRCLDKYMEEDHAKDIQSDSEIQS